MRNATPLLVISWIITGCVCVWGASLFTSLKYISESPAPNSQGQTGKPSYEGTEPQDATNPSLRGTERSPLVVVMRRSREDEIAADKAQQQAEENTRINRRQAWFNGGLLVCTALQIALLVRANKSARKDRQEDKRANLTFDLRNWSGVNIEIPIQCLFTYTNYGLTPAINVGFRAIAECAPLPISQDGEGLPPMRGDFDQNRLNVFPSATSHVTHSQPVNFGRNMTPDELRQVAIDKTHYFVIGIEVIFTDIFDVRWHTKKYFALPTSGEILIIPGTSKNWGEE